tara:strand:- start:1260 stop:2849 length:1590 start_codon:yes stop_codon:yes gene_type:complete
MREIPIFKAEADIAGLAEQIRADSSICYATKLEPYKPETDIANMAKANLSDWLGAHAATDDPDLYFTRSILVTSNWNLNDDVFDRLETWGARHTPAHKPTNIGHDEHEIVGHMTDNWVIDTEGKVIADTSSIDEVPNLFHIVTGAVIYTAWADPALVERTQKLIAEIEAGTKFVSMECLFTNFGYALISSDGKFSALARDENTAFLTKHLRRYGGQGTYNGYRIGRLLKNITFSAKGYVDEPANPESIILNGKAEFSFEHASQKNPFNTNSGVSIPVEDDTSIQRETSDMSENIYKEQAEKLETQVATLTTKLEGLQTEHSKANVDALHTEIETLTAKVTDLTGKHVEAAAKVTELTAANETLEADKTEATEERDALKVKVEAAQLEARTASRVSELVEAGADKEAAEKKVAVFASSTDEQWAVVADTLKEAYSAFFDKKDDDKKDDKKKKDDAKADADDASDEEKDAAEAGADDSVLESAKAEKEAALAAAAKEADGEDATASVRQELQRAIATRLGKSLPEDNKEDK